MNVAHPLPLRFLATLIFLGLPLLSAETDVMTLDAAEEPLDALTDFASEANDVYEVSDDVSLDFGDASVAADDEEYFDDEDEVILEDGDLITVNYPDESIRRVLRNVADLYGINVVIPDTLVGNTSIKLRDVTWRQVFDIVLKPVGFTYVEDKNIVSVVSVDDISREPMQLQTFPIKYAKASEVAASLSPIIQSEGGAVQVDNRSNALLVRERPSILKQIDTLLKTSSLDRPALQVMIQTKFIEVAQNVGSDNDGLGFDWWGTGALFGSDNKFLRADGQLDVFNNFGGSTLKTAVLKGTEYAMTLRALKTDANANLIASPTVVTLNNETAEFHVGTNKPIIEANYDTATGTFTVGEVEYLPVGVRVNVTPRVNAGADQITLNINPKVSKADKDLTFSSAGGELKYPIEDIRETHTTVSIKNGYTLALGGLIQDDDTDIIERVPCLGDLPLVGKIFQRKNKKVNKINLIMFITAKTLNPDGSTYHEVVDPRQIAAMGISDADIPGYANGIETPGMAQISSEHLRRLQELQDERNECYDINAKRDLKYDKYALRDCAASKFPCPPKRYVQFRNRAYCDAPKKHFSARFR